jgi:hypothetical protein
MPRAYRHTYNVHFDRRSIDVGVKALATGDDIDLAVEDYCR